MLYEWASPRKIARYGVYHCTDRYGSHSLLRCRGARLHAPRSRKYGKRGFVSRLALFQVRHACIRVGKRVWKGTSCTAPWCRFLSCKGTTAACLPWQGQVLQMERRISTAGFFFFKVVLPFSIFVRSYSSLPTLQGWAAVESIGTTRIRHTQALWTQGVTTNNR